MPAPIVIGQSNCFWFWFFDSHLKTALLVIMTSNLLSGLEVLFVLYHELFRSPIRDRVWKGVGSQQIRIKKHQLKTSGEQKLLQIFFFPKS